MVSIVAATGDLFLATDRSRVTLEHLRRKLRFRPYVSPDPILEDLEGQATIVHPGHVRTFLVVPRGPLDECLADLVWKTVHLLMNRPPGEIHPENYSTRHRPASGKKRSRLVTDPKLPFVFGPMDYLAIVRIKPAVGKGETVGVLVRYLARRARAKDSRRHAPLLPVLNPSDLLTPASFNSVAQETAAELHQLPWLRC